MKQKEYICVLCPKSCPITVSVSDSISVPDSAVRPEVLDVRGFQCARGREWAVQESIRPERYFVGSVSVRNGDFETVSVKSSGFVPLDMITRLGLHTHRLVVEAPVGMHEVVEQDVLGLEGVDLIATREVQRRA